MTIVTAARTGGSYVLLIEHGSTHMTAAINTRLLSLALAAAFVLPAALATLNQAALIVA